MSRGVFGPMLFFTYLILTVLVYLYVRIQEPDLISHFLKKISLINHKDFQRVSTEAMDAIRAYQWPGNVRQIINALEYAAISCKDSTIEINDLPEYLFKKSAKSEVIEKDYKDRSTIVTALSKFNWNRTLTARHLGISRVTLWKLMKEMDIS